MGGAYSVCNFCEVKGHASWECSVRAAVVFMVAAAIDKRAVISAAA